MTDVSFMKLEDLAKELNFKINEHGRCRQLEKLTDKKHCEERGIKPLPCYFSKGKNIQVDPKDFIEWRKQFLMD